MKRDPDVTEEVIAVIHLTVAQGMFGDISVLNFVLSLIIFSFERKDLRKL